MTVFFHSYSQTNSYVFAMTLTTQDDHLTTKAWAAYDQSKLRM